jgi:hypothetical protein
MCYNDLDSFVGLIEKEVVMKTKYLLGIIFILGFTVVICNIAYSQSSRCVILDKKNDTALISCNGGATQSTSLGGRSDLYKVGDTIDYSTPQTAGTRGTGIPGDPRSSSDKMLPPRAR